MRYSLVCLALLCAAAPAAAQSDLAISEMIATSGLAAAADTLAALPAPTATDRFALGGVRFLGALETALQARYAAGIPDSFSMLVDLPVLRLPIPENPTPGPFDPAMIEQMFGEMTADLALAIAALDGITDADAVSLRIDTADIWFDITGNGKRDEGEGLGDVTGFLLGGFEPVPMNITVNFDTADAAWLSAYAHLLSGLSEVFLAFSPTESIRTVLDAEAAMATLAPPVDAGLGYMDMPMMRDMADLFAILIGAIEQQPDPAHTQAAHAHLLDMIADNRTFWLRVAKETDNDAEWIPNKNQQSVLPIAFPADTGTRWLLVLSEAEALLNGTLLVPYWRLGDGAGINIGRMFTDPPLVDIAAFIQGYGLLPYMERGPLISGQSLMAFDQLVQGNAGLYMIVLN